MKFFNAILIFLTTLSLSPKNEMTSPEKPLVLVSIAPYAFITEKIAGDTVTVKILAPPGSNPHTYEPTFKSMDGLEKCVLWFQIGELFEGKVLKILNSLNPGLQTIDLLQEIKLISSGHCSHCSQVDRHIWLSPQLLQKQAEKITLVLKKQFPSNSHLYATNLSNFSKEVEELNIKILQLFNALSQKAILISHPSLGYFCKDYRLTQVATEKEGGADPSSKEIGKLLNLARELKIKSAFVSPQHNNKGVKLIAEKLKLKTISLDPYNYNIFNSLEMIAKEISIREKEKICQTQSN